MYFPLSLFYSAGCHTFDEILLEAYEQDEDRHNGEEGTHYQQAVIISVRVDQGVQTKGQRILSEERITSSGHR